MAVKTYRIVDGTVTHPTAGVIVKENIEYYIDHVLETKEFYSKNGVVDHEIRAGYSDATGLPPQAIVPNETDLILGE